MAFSACPDGSAQHCYVQLVTRVLWLLLVVVFCILTSFPEIGRQFLFVKFKIIMIFLTLKSLDFEEKNGIGENSFFRMLQFSNIVQHLALFVHFGVCI